MDISAKRTMRSMTSAAEAMARGDYSMRMQVTSHDEVGRLSAAFNRMAEDLAKADKYRRALLSNLSHELKTPITALRAILENLADGVTDPEPATLALALRQTERLGQVVTELLELSHPENGAPVLGPEDFDIQGWLTALAAPYERISLTVDPPTLRVHADSARLTQVADKLVEDAIRNAPPDTDIMIHAHRTDNMFHLDIIDERPETTALERNDPFEQFFKGGSTDGGSGLGLSVAKWATELQAGSIEILNLSAGRHVRVSLPQPCT